MRLRFHARMISGSYQGPSFSRAEKVLWRVALASVRRGPHKPGFLRKTQESRPGETAAIANDQRSLGNYEELRQYILKGEYNIKQKSAGYNMKMIFESCATLMDILLDEYRYDLWYAPKDSFFLTSDNPVVTICPTRNGGAYVGVGFKWQETEAIFPLNKRVCLVLARHCREEKSEVSQRRVNQINDLMMGFAQQYVYASVGYRRVSRLFDERGCKFKYGKNAFMSRLMPDGPMTADV